MTEQSVVYILCPNCECAVRKLDATTCPNCSRCPFCGSKSKTDSSCDCSSQEDSEYAERLLKEFGIPEDQVARETRRMEIRKQLVMKKAVVIGLFAGILVVSSRIIGEIFERFTWSYFGAYFMFVLVVFMPLISFIQWVFRRIENRRLQLQDDLLDESRNTE